MHNTQTNKCLIGALFISTLILLSGCGGGSSSSTYTTSRPRTPPPLPSLPIGLYTDLQSAPVGAYVTVYSIGTGTSSWPIVLQRGDKTVVQVPSAPQPPLTVNGQSIPVSVHTGRVITVTPSTMAAAVQSLQPGDTIYLRAGTYSGKYDNEGWNESNIVLFKSGTSTQPIAFVAYPGETVTISNSQSRPNFHLGDGTGTRMASYLTIAGLNLVAPAENIFGGGYTADSSRPEAGATHVRLVRNTFTLTNNNANTMTGMVSFQGDSWKVLGNTFVNSLSRTIYNNNHAIYIQDGADDAEVAYNLLAYLRMGHVIQVHQDGTPMLYTNIWVHDNMLAAASNGDMRGITVSNVDSVSTVTIENNTLINLGQDFSGIAVYRGIVTIHNNLMYDIKAPAILLQGQLGGTRAVTASGNRFSTVSGYPAVTVEDLALMSDITLSGNSYCGSSTVLLQDPTGTVCW